jgi:hypothetical protein
VRPHEALHMKTPHQLWTRSLRPYREPSPTWTYPADREVKEVDRTGQFRLAGHRHYISKALAGREVGLLELDQRILVYYHHTLVCELNPLQPRSIAAASE